MPSQNNVENMLDSDYQNHNYLPQNLSLEDSDQAMFDFFSNMGFSVVDSTNVGRKVNVIYLSQELWAERRKSWNIRMAENGEEVLMPFMTLIRTSVKTGSSPLKYTIPNKKKFNFLKVPTFDGTLKGYDLYKIPQPAYVDLGYELNFLSHYQQDTNLFYEKIMRDVFSDGQLYLNVKGYPISCIMESTSEENSVDNINSERIYMTSVSMVLRSKLVDSSQFEKVPVITKVAIKIVEKK